MMQHYGMFFIFISVMAYIAAICASVLISIKTMTLNTSVFNQLLIHHLFFAVGIFMSWDIIKGFNFHPKRIFKMALNLSLPSLQFLLILNGIFLGFNAFQGRFTIYEIIHFLTYLALFLHFRKLNLI